MDNNKYVYKKYDITVRSNFSIEDDILEKYLYDIKVNNGDTLCGVKEIDLIAPNEDSENINVVIHTEKIDRIRRVTGYLSGTTDRWNNAKQAEERDRVKHI